MIFTKHIITYWVARVAGSPRSGRRADPATTRPGTGCALTRARARVPARRFPYTCCLSSRTQCYCDACIAEPPHIHPFTIDSGYHEGGRVGWQCFITKGDGPLNIQWLKDGQSLDPAAPPPLSVTYPNQYSSSVAIESILVAHEGNYTCRVSNSVATVEHAVKLTVLGTYTRFEARARARNAPHTEHLPYAVRGKRGRPSLTRPRELLPRAARVHVLKSLLLLLLSSRDCIRRRDHAAGNANNGLYTRVHCYNSGSSARERRFAAELRAVRSSNIIRL